LAAGVGEATFLGLGLGWFSISFLLMGLAGGYLALLVLMAAAGIGGGVYHPVGTAWVSRAFLGGRRGAAVGTLNFAGDLGKVALPALAGVLVVWIGWRGSLTVLGAAGALAALALLVWAWLGHGANGRARPQAHPARAPGWGIARPWQFALIATIGFIDQAGRSAVMAFLGFLLLARGLPESALGWLVAVTFAGGGFGKFGCGLLTDRVEDRRVMAMTESLMATGCLVLAFIDPGVLLVPLLLVFGFALNGTSSVIYTRLADTLRPESFSKGYGLYYTLSFAASAIAPILYGFLADGQGLVAVYVGIAIMNLCILPLLMLLKGTVGTGDAEQYKGLVGN
jgi:MFS family permease